MVDKSKSHEEELEQTFGSYETEMPEEEPANKSGEKKKSGNLVKYLIIGVGALAVLFVIWTMVLPLLTGGGNRQAPRPQANPGQVQNQNVNQNNNAAPSVNVEPVPEVSVNTAPTVNVPTVSVEPAQNGQPTSQVNDFLNNQNGQAANNTAPSVTVTPSDNNSNITITMPEETQVTVAPAVQQPVVAQQAASVAQVSNGDLMNDIRSYFDSKFENIQQADRVRGEQLQKVEVSVDNLVQRVTALEKGGVKSVTVRPTNVVTNTVRKAPVAKNVVRKEVVEKEVVEVKRAPVEPSERVIASKAGVTRGGAGDELLIVKKPKAEVNRYKVHSLFNGRVWIENADNTHSSFSVNDRLPGGELIKSIDMEKDLIITDKGTIKGK